MLALLSRSAVHGVATYRCELPTRRAAAPPCYRHGSVPADAPGAVLGCGLLCGDCCRSLIWSGPVLPCFGRASLSCLAHEDDDALPAVRGPRAQARLAREPVGCICLRGSPDPDEAWLESGETIRV